MKPFGAMLTRGKPEAQRPQPCPGPAWPVTGKSALDTVVLIATHPMEQYEVWEEQGGLPEGALH